VVTARDQPGSLYQLTRVIWEHRANIAYADVASAPRGRAGQRPASATGEGEAAGSTAPGARMYFELEEVADPAGLVADLAALDVVQTVEETPTFLRIFGKRVIVIGGGAQVGQVALGAISEADRHNIRGERISVDTIALVGEENLAAAVRAVTRLPRARILVLAGALMGGDITQAVREVRESGIPVISLNMAGSVPSAADLVVSDPVQAGVMAVMAIANTAKFDIRRQHGKVY
jgi:energy-converting hydrogenase B subunit Q